MEDANHQDDNGIAEEDESIDTGDDINDEDEGADLDLDETTIQILRQNKGINYLSVQLNCDYDSGKCPFFNSVDWKKDGDCVSKHTHLKTIVISHIGKCLDRDWGEHYILGEQGPNLPTKEQLQDFFACIYQNRSINHISFCSIGIVDEFGGELLGGLRGHPSLTQLGLNGKIGSMACSALVSVLKDPTCKLKGLRLSNCQLDDQRLSTLCDSLLGNIRMERLSVFRDTQITSAGWRALSKFYNTLIANWLT